MADDAADVAGPLAPFFPVDYAATYLEARSCNQSVDHDLIGVRILASPMAYPAYVSRRVPFPVGSVVVKEEFDDWDLTTRRCEKIKRWTAAIKGPPGTDPALGDWIFQVVSPERVVTAQGQDAKARSCRDCHAICGTAVTPRAVSPGQKPHPSPNDGYDHMCAD